MLSMIDKMGEEQTEASTPNDCRNSSFEASATRFLVLSRYQASRALRAVANGNIRIKGSSAEPTNPRCR